MTTVRRVTRWMLTLAAIATGCGGELAPVVCDGGSCGTQSSWRTKYQQAINRKVDLLFVVDDTAAIAPHRDALARRVHGDGADVARHAGPYVASRRLRPGGQLRHQHARRRVRRRRAGTVLALGVVPHDRQLRRRVTNRHVRVPGGSRRGGLRASRSRSRRRAAALTGAAQPGWEGFLRPDAYLMIVVVTAQDDASGQPAGLTPRAIADTIKAVKPDPSQIVVSIIGPGGDCAAGEPPGAAPAGVRQRVRRERPLSPACAAASSHPRWTASRSRSTARSCHPARANVRDTDPETPGLQANCTVEELVPTTRTARCTSSRARRTATPRRRPAGA